MRPMFLRSVVPSTVIRSCGGPEDRGDVFGANAPLPTDLDGGKSAVGDHAPHGVMVAFEQLGYFEHVKRRL